jgi:hypothetical protein
MNSRNQLTSFAKATQPTGLVLISLIALGCNSGNAGRASVSGKVTFDGQPIATGQIVFEPAGSGRLGIAQIANGAYSMPPEQGPTPGKYTVRITADRPTGKTAAALASSGGQAPTQVYEQYIPAKYNERSELTVEIGAEPDAVHDFALTGG